METPQEAVDRVIADAAHAIGEELTAEDPSCALAAERSADGSWDAIRVFKFIGRNGRTMREQEAWQGVFDGGLTLDEAEMASGQDATRRFQEIKRVESLAWELVWWRTAKAHQRNIDWRDAIRALDSAERLLTALGMDGDAAVVTEHRERLVLAYATHIRQSGWGSPVQQAGPVPRGSITAAITWANQTGGDGWLEDLWFAVIDDSGLQFDRARPDDVVEIIRGLASRGEQVTVGFAFSLGAPTAVMGRGQRWGKPSEMWSDIADLADQYPDMQERLRAAPAPFWGLGLPGSSAPPKGDVHRATERRVEEAVTPTHSILQLTGHGNVGSLSLAGIPLLRPLIEDGFRVWPFHDPPGDLRIVEVFPRALLQYLSPERAEDYDPREAFLASSHARALRIGRDSEAALSNSLRAFDAVFCAWALREYGDPLPSFPSDDDARVEGEIWLPT